MAANVPTPVQADGLQGLKYFKILRPFLDRLHADATARDKAGNRRLYFDQYACLLLLFFFNPLIKSLRSIQQASQLDKVQQLLGCGRASLGSLSEASRVFDPKLLQEILGQLASQAVPLVDGKEAEALRGLTAVDGSLLPALPKMAWALWLDPQHRAAKMHVHFDVLKGVPLQATVTHGNASETAQLRATLQGQRLYVIEPVRRRRDSPKAHRSRPPRLQTRHRAIIKRKKSVRNAKAMAMIISVPRSKAAYLNLCLPDQKAHAAQSPHSCHGPALTGKCRLNAAASRSTEQ